MTFPSNLVMTKPTRILRDTKGVPFSSVEKTTSDAAYIENEKEAREDTAMNTDFTNRMAPDTGLLDTREPSPWEQENEQSFSDPSEEVLDDSFWEDTQRGVSMQAASPSGSGYQTVPPAENYETPEVIKGGSDAILLGAMIFGVAIAVYSTFK